MTFDSKARLSGLLGAATLAALSMAALLPTKWVPPTGLGWQVEHFSIYFATAFVLYIAFRRPYVVAISVVTSSAILEALQGLTPDRVPDLTSALCGAAGAISATLLIDPSSERGGKTIWAQCWHATTSSKAQSSVRTILRPYSRPQV